MNKLRRFTVFRLGYRQYAALDTFTGHICSDVMERWDAREYVRYLNEEDSVA